MTKGDIYTKEIFKTILENGCLDKNPRPHYEDNYENAFYDYNTNTIITKENTVIEVNKNQIVRQLKDKVQILTPAHTYSVNTGIECVYDISKNESPLITLRPIATKNSIAEILWIYQKESNDLVDFDELIGKNTWDKNHKINNWWDEWALRDKFGNYILNEKGHPHIGQTYGKIVKDHNLVKKRLQELHDNPDGRRHIISLWQEDDYDMPHGLKPCAFMTIWNVRHEKDNKDYLDMTMVQRSSDFATAGCINQVQYLTLQLLFAKHLGLNPGYFTWKPINVQIYDRHVNQVKELLRRQPIECNPTISLNENKTNFYDFIPDDIKIDAPKELIKRKNPQLKFELGI